MTDSTLNETSSVFEDVMSIIKEAVDASIQNAVYQHNKVPQWTSAVIEYTLKKLQETNSSSSSSPSSSSSFKYIGMSQILNNQATSDYGKTNQCIV
ncbi:cytoplasmic dynein light chain [Cavenderia fasciculata]|uniref:Cytoplasmic dynein light chain n=1 Tax=Cavenderia fasciculata TaxID=261658 RepID=F4PYF5_CACFS|nr:cytoplasmic dynein light chain [Cavenderia fasciculata]EGG19422.1 cytoplasmic dynein light chain [Cavenderia fasciculata]|eukprot:XP_004357693.1 cytoplasmic dynein light chain [Cavenderia fasciculata]